MSRFLGTAIAFSLLTACGSDPGFPEDRAIDGPFRITDEWQVIEFEPPLQINREGTQSLHFVLDEARYSYAETYADNGDAEFYLKQDDGKVLRPDVVLQGTQGQTFETSAVGNASLYAGGISMGFGLHIDNFTPPPDFPKSVSAIQSVRVRSDVPFTADRLKWWVMNHPDHHRCGNRRCSWWQEVLLWFY